MTQRNGDRKAERGESWGDGKSGSCRHAAGLKGIWRDPVKRPFLLSNELIELLKMLLPASREIRDQLI